MTTTSFGEQVATYRERLGMRQNALAERVEITASHLNRIEKGVRKAPEAETVLRLMDVLRLSRDEAEAFVLSAGYSSLILQAGRGLSYSSPTLSPSPYDRLIAALDQLPEAQRERCIDAVVTLIQSLVPETPNTERRDARDARSE